jgi:hypothetical protein
MKIYNRYTGKLIVDVKDIKVDLIGAYLSGANLSRANLSGANLSEANLSRAYLYGANLSEADLSRANLYGADLYGANLFGANLFGADLSEAKIYEPFSIEVDNIYYKSVNYIEGKILSPTHNKEFEWEVGKTYTENCNMDKRELCAEGLHLFTKSQALQWEGTHLLKVRVLKGDICVPYASDGKFRVGKLKVLELIDKKDVK